MAGRCWIHGLVLVAMATAAGCPASSPPPATPAPAKRLSAAQEQAVRDYVAILEKQLDQVEEAVDILATVTRARETWPIASGRMAALSTLMDKTVAKVQSERPNDPDVLDACQRQLQDRVQKLQARQQAEIRRIVSPEVGGLDFFEKELRPALKGVHTGQ
jgi:hypothetical protein